MTEMSLCGAVCIHVYISDSFEDYAALITHDDLQKVCSVTPLLCNVLSQCVCVI